MVDSKDSQPAARTGHTSSGLLNSSNRSSANRDSSNQGGRPAACRRGTGPPGYSQNSCFSDSSRRSGRPCFENRRGPHSRNGVPETIGNMGIAVHRDTFFRPLRGIQPNDTVTLTTSLARSNRGTDPRQPAGVGADCRSGGRRGRIDGGGLWKRDRRR
jgi:hypothetical protein